MFSLHLTWWLCYVDWKLFITWLAIICFMCFLMHIIWSNTGNSCLFLAVKELWTSAEVRQIYFQTSKHLVLWHTLCININLFIHTPVNDARWLIVGVLSLLQGVWQPHMIPNPNYFKDVEPYKMTPIVSMQSSSIMRTNR